MAQKKVEAEIAQANLTLHQATQTGYVPSTDIIKRPPSSGGAPTPSRLKAIDRLTLNGLFVEGENKSAYLSLDGNNPTLAKIGERLHGVTITNITGQGVQLTQGDRTRVLEGKL